jgi:hypothetical protein
MDATRSSGTSANPIRTARFVGHLFTHLRVLHFGLMRGARLDAQLRMISHRFD